MFLADLLVVFAVTAVVVFAFGHFRLPSVVGLLVSGVLVGPYGLSLVADVETVKLLAEIGVIVLLFTVGLEFSMSRLIVMLPLMARIGLPQIVGTTLLVTLATWWYLGTVAQALFAGLLVAMSSTVIVLKLLADRCETGTPHGRIAVAVLLLQDLLVVVAMLAVPLLADAAGTEPFSQGYRWPRVNTATRRSPKSSRFATRSPACSSCRLACCSTSASSWRTRRS